MSGGPATSDRPESMEMDQFVESRKQAKRFDDRLARSHRRCRRAIVWFDALFDFFSDCTVLVLIPASSATFV
jgi:hypothetical protein